MFFVVQLPTVFNNNWHATRHRQCHKRRPLGNGNAREPTQVNHRNTLLGGVVNVYPTKRSRLQNNSFEVRNFINNLVGELPLVKVRVNSHNTRLISFIEFGELIKRLNFTEDSYATRAVEGRMVFFS